MQSAFTLFISIFRFGRFISRWNSILAFPMAGSPRVMLLISSARRKALIILHSLYGRAGEWPSSIANVNNVRRRVKMLWHRLIMHDTLELELLAHSRECHEILLYLEKNNKSFYDSHFRLLWLSYCRFHSLLIAISPFSTLCLKRGVPAPGRCSSVHNTWVRYTNIAHLSMPLISPTFLEISLSPYFLAHFPCHMAKQSKHTWVSAMFLPLAAFIHLLRIALQLHFIRAV